MDTSFPSSPARATTIPFLKMKFDAYCDEIFSFSLLGLGSYFQIKRERRNPCVFCMHHHALASSHILSGISILLIPFSLISSDFMTRGVVWYHGHVLWSLTTSQYFFYRAFVEVFPFSPDLMVILYVMRSYHVKSCI